MADLNKGKFQGLDENAKNNYADSFKGATKVAEKVKKGGSEKASDGYVVDAIDIDWGCLKLTTISDRWSFGLQTVSSTEQNAGKGDNTQGIHSTAYLLNLISSSFTQIYNEIGGTDEAGLRKRIKVVEDDIHKMAELTPGDLNVILKRIKQIEDELSDPGATTAVLSILDTLDGFDKNKKGDVKKYIDDHDKAILGSTADAATVYSVYGVRKYVDTTAKNSLIGASTDATTADTIWGAKNYAENLASSSYTDAVNNAVKQAKEYTNQAIGTAESTLIGSTADTTINTHWGVKNSLIGQDGDQTIDTHWGVRFLSYYYTDAAAGNVLGKSGDLWPTQRTVYGVAEYADEKIEALSNTAFKVRRIEEGGEGILVFSTVNSHAG